MMKTHAPMPKAPAMVPPRALVMAGGAAPLMAAVVALMVAALPHAAWAHPHGHAPGAGGPFLSGVLHPLTGLDHLLAMVAVGLWAALAGGRALWALPAAFLGLMLAGFGLGAGGVALPAVEPVILASVIVLGGVLALSLRLPLAAAAAMVGLFGLAHGHAHGTEGPAAGLWAYAAGFGLATAALHAAGLALGQALGHWQRPLAGRALGGLAVLAGVGMVFL